MIKRPKQVERSQKSYLSNEKYQDYAEQQFKNIYDYLDGTGYIPIGIGFDYYGITAPTNYMFADGSEISRTEYAELFAIIGTTYGSGDGSTTFNLPDKRERVSVMYKENSTNGTTGATLGILGAKGGEFKHTISETELTAHYHDYDANILGVYWDSPLGYLSSSGTLGVSRINENPTHQTGWKGNGTAMNIMQSYLVCNYIIKVK